MNCICRSLVRLTLACVSLLLSGAVGAQMTDGNSLPQALKDIKRATGKCLRDDVALQPGTAATLASTPDLTCAATVAEVAELMGKPETSVADLRLATEFHAFHIASATNLTSAELHGKPYWRNKTLILVGDGKAEAELYRECSRLKQTGYRQVRVLQGGMSSWLSQGKPVIGRAPAATQLVRLSAAELWAESQNGLGRVLLDPAQAEMRADLPGAQVLPQTSAAALQAAVSTGKGKKKAASLALVTLVALPTLTDDQIRQLQQAVAPLPLLVYAGTRDTYVRAMASQKAIWHAQERGPKRPGCGL
jgi:rhodanese-related sulfurtransferase